MYFSSTWLSFSYKRCIQKMNENSMYIMWEDSEEDWCFVQIQKMGLNLYPVVMLVWRSWSSSFGQLCVSVDVIFCFCRSAVVPHQPDLVAAAVPAAGGTAGQGAGEAGAGARPPGLGSPHAALLCGALRQRPGRHSGLLPQQLSRRRWGSGLF